jgi:hypothetical protein
MLRVLALPREEADGERSKEPVAGRLIKVSDEGFSRSNLEFDMPPMPAHAAIASGDAREVSSDD